MSGPGYGGSVIGAEVQGFINPAAVDLDMAGYNIIMSTGWIGRAASAVTFDANENVVITEGLYLGSNGVGNNAEVLSFATGATGLATLAGALTIGGNLLIGANSIGNDAAVISIASGATGLVTMTGALTIGGNLLVGSGGIGNDNPIITFASGATGASLFAGPLQLIAGTEAAPAIGWIDTGFYERAADSIGVSIGGSIRARFDIGGIRSDIGDGFRLSNTAATSTVPSIKPSNSDGNAGMGWAGTGQPSMIGNSVESQRWIPKVDTDSDTDDVLATGVSGFHGLAMVISLTDNVSAIFHIDNTTLTSNISLNAAITSTKDNAGTYNFYYETDQFKLQNKVGDNKSVQVIFWVVPT